MRLSARTARTIVQVCLLVGLAGPAVVLVAVAGRITETLDWRTAFETLTQSWAARLSMAGLAAGAIALVAAIWARPRWMWAVAAVALAAPAAVLAGLAGLQARSERAPPIHDVSTNWEDPVTFSERLLALRGSNALPVHRDPRLQAPWSPRGVVSEGWNPTRVADINRLTCPGARPVDRLVPQAEVTRVLEAHGVLVSGAAPWRVEGSWRSTWFHLRDDVAVRMRPGRTDVRSVSRERESDLGDNCARVTSIVRAFQAGAR